MTTSKTIAGLIGPTLVAIAASMLLNIGSFPALAEQVSRDPALIFVSGILLFVAGLAIVRVHNRWTNGWPVVCTENLNPNVLTMKSAQYGARIYDAGSLNLARDRRIFVQ